MSPRAVRGSVATAVGTALLGLLLLDVARTASTVIAVIGAIGGAACAVAVVGLLRADRFEARLTAAVVATASTVLAGVGMVLGAPGSSGGGLSVRGVLVALGGVVVLVLLWLAARGRAAQPPTTRPYAR